MLCVRKYSISHLWAGRIIRCQFDFSGKLCPFFSSSVVILGESKLRNTFLSLNVYRGYCLLTTCSRIENIFLSPSLYPYLDGVWGRSWKRMQAETRPQCTGYNVCDSLGRFQRFRFTLRTSVAEHFDRSENLIMLFWTLQVLEQDFLYFISRDMP